MKTVITALLFAAAMTGFSVTARVRPAPNAPRSRPSPASQVFLTPAEVVSVENVSYPPNTTAEGVVVLDVALTEKGQAAEVGAVRDIPALTSAAATAVQSWKFKPATQGDTAVPSALTVAFVYRPPVAIWKPPSFSAAVANPGSSTNAAIPAGITAITYADYPSDSTAAGAVILQLSLDSTGKITDTKILRGMGALNASALAAAKEWKFEPARFEGDTAKSNVVIAFIFAPPVLNP